jgi:prenyltransferase beta subunit
MRAIARVAGIMVLCGLALPDVQARAQSVADFAQTAAYAAGHQNPDGGFAPAPGQPSSLGATNSGLRVLEYVGGSVPDVPACIQYVKSCKVPGSGFAPTPGGKPDVVTTAVGVLAAAELKIADQAMIDDVIAFFGANAKAFEEVRMSIAGLEAVAAKSPDFPRWAKQIEEMRKPDGSFGEGTGKAFATGGAAAAILRMGMDLDKRDEVIAAIKAGQRPDGAWSKDDGPSDLSSSYRVMRALYMLKEKPDEAKLLGFIARCRQSDGSYSNTPDGPGSLGSTYFAAIIMRWLRLLNGGSSVLESTEFTPLFNGKDLTGWEGLTEYWAVKDGALVGSSDKNVPFNTFLCSKKKYKDFELSFKVKLKNGVGNSGVQVRSKIADAKQYAVAGPQCDIGAGYWGSLYGERFGGMMQQAPKESQKSVKPKDFNDYSIKVVGQKVTIKVNGVTTVDKEFDKLPAEGVIAFQLHAGGPMEVTYKDIKFKELKSE